MTVTTYDELNRLNGVQKSMSFDDYFGEMVISEEQKDKRKKLADSFFDEFVFVLAWAFYTAQQRAITAKEIEPVLKEHYEKAAKNGVDIEGDIKEYIDNIVIEISETTANRQDSEYTFTEDRARLLAENESNTLLNMQEFKDAKEVGYRYKRWNTIIDGKERDTHAFAEGQERPIDEPFEVGGYYMNFPKDDSFGASPEEIINCRCSVTFF